MKKLTPSDSPSPICKPHHHQPPNTVDDLLPPIVSDAVRPIDGAERGLGIRHIEPWLIVHILPWGQLKAGDIFKVYMGSFTFALASDEVRKEDLDNTDFTLVIDQSLVPRGYVYPCFAEVIRFGSGTPSNSPWQTWYTKTTRPGGLSTNPYYHSRLILHLPPGLENGGVLDPEGAEDGVDLTIDPYPNMTLGDTIEVWWNGHPVFLEIDQDHLDGLDPIVVHVPEQTIIDGGSGVVVIYFRIFDTVFNFSGEVPQWSKPVNVDADLDPNELERPHLVVNGHSVTEVNIDTVGDGQYQAEVYVPRRLPNGTTTPVGALIHMTVVVFDADGGSTTTPLPAFPARIGLSATTDLDSELIEMAVNGHVQLRYTLTTATGTPLGTSRRLNVAVSGTRKSMPAMTIDPIEGDTIDPEIAFFRAIFPKFSPYDADWNVTFRMEAITPEGRLIEYEEELLAGAKEPPPLPRIVRKDQFERFIGLPTVRVFYLVQDDQKLIMAPGIQTVRKSDVLEVRIGAVTRTMPPPQLQYLDPFNNLDPDSIIGGSLNLTLTETRTLPGDIFTWSWQGSNSSGGTVGDDVKLNPGTAGKPVVIPIDAKYAIANNNGEIRLSYTLLPADDGPRRYSELLIVTVGKALTLLRPEVLQATRYPDQLAALAALHGATIEVQYPQMTPSHRIEACWSGIPGIGTYCETKDGNTSKVLHFEIDPEVVGANIQAQGHFIQVQYFVIQGQHRKPSPVLNLELLPPPLPKSYLEGHSLDAVLDISTLKGTERALVDPWPFIHHFQWAWFDMLGTYADDSPFYHAFYYPSLVGLDGEQNGLHPLAPISELRKLKDGTQVSMRCAVTFDQSTDLSNAVWFPQRNYTVQALPAQYPVPVLAEASGSGTLVTLAPKNAENGAHVQVSYIPMALTDKIYLEVLGTPGRGSTVIGPLSGTSNGTVIVPLDAALIAANIGNTRTQFTIRYTVTKGLDTRPSTLLTVNLEPLSQADLKNTVIKIDEANASNVINLDTLVGNATARVTTWPFIARYQPVWLRLFGTDPNGKAHNLTLLDGSNNGAVDAAWINQGYHLEQVLNSYLGDLGHNSLLTMELKVALNGEKDELRAIVFPPTRYTLYSVMVHNCTSFTDNYMNFWLSK
ncbi:hypothetical protein [Pseudomonas sp.]|uniref:hypothetical protein n=1 Tax=Pseudomonas sp. TaxID=306 RepID=UPI003D6EEB11